MSPRRPRRLAASIVEFAGTDFQDVREKFACWVKFMPPRLLFEAIIGERFAWSEQLPQLALIVTCYAVIRRVIHAWFRTPRGDNRSGSGDTAGSQSGQHLGGRCPKAGGWCARSRRFGSRACPTTSARRSATSISRNIRFPGTGTRCARPRNIWPATSSSPWRPRSLRWWMPGLADGGVDPTRIGIDLGAGLISSELDELAPAIGQAYEAGKSFDFPGLGPRVDRDDRADLAA